MADARRRIGLLTAWLSRRNGGVFEAVIAHARMVRAAGDEPVVIGLADNHSAADRGRLGDGEVIACPTIGPGMVGYAPSLVRRLRDADVDLLHLHGIWTYPSAAAASWAAASGRPLVVSPHGMLDPWIVRRGKVKKAVARWGFERRCWRRAALFHALTDVEAADIRNATVRSTTAVIPNPVEAASRGAASHATVALYLGRIHPKKNVEALVDAWADAADVLRPIGARLVIAGWGEERHIQSLMERIAAHPHGNASFVGPLFGTAKEEALATARFVLLASHSEGLPMTMLEAWAHGTPTLMSAACNLPSGFAAGAAIDCGTDRRSIAGALRTGFAADAAAWSRMSDAALTLAADFAPERIGARWSEVYRSLLACDRAAAA